MLRSRCCSTAGIGRCFLLYRLRLGRLLKNDSSIPPMGHVGGLDISDFPASDIDNLSVGKYSWRTMGPTVMDSRHASAPCINSALDAAANHSFIEPHSSASK